jgi:transposase
MAEVGRKAVAADDEVVASVEVKELQRKIRELERVLGKKTLENEMLKDAVDLTHQKKTDLAVALVTRGQYSMKKIADTLGVSRSHLSQRRKEAPKERGDYHKTTDAQDLVAIRALVDERPT